VELVRDRSSREPARDALGRLVTDLLRRGMLVLPGGLHENTLMLLPPLTMRREQVNHGLALLDESLAAL
jgi:4-aminobutyrate aminotransferase/(S)-3-amino-2-methylpropionate transaminase